MYFLIVAGVPDDTDEALVGYLTNENISPVGDYELVLLENGRQTSRATLLGYPRWSEPAFGLVARLLSRLPETAVGMPLVDKFEVSLQLGETFDSAQPIEYLSVSVLDDVLNVGWTDCYCSRFECAFLRPSYKGLAQLLEHAARIAMWGTDIEPALARPLTEVPVRHAGGKRYVLAADMPPHAQRHFTGMKYGTTGPLPGTYDADEWLAFIAAKDAADASSSTSVEQRQGATWTRLH